MPTTSRWIHELLFEPTDRWRIQFIRYLLVGGVAFAFDFGSLWFLTSGLRVHYLVSAAAAFLIGMLVNYLLSVFWIFRLERFRSASGEFALFGLIGLLGLGINELGMWLLTGRCSLDFRISKLATTFLVLIWNFSARKWFVFSSPRSQAS